MHALPKAVLHVLRHAKSGLTRRARQARGGFLARFLPKGSKILEKAAMLAAKQIARLEGLENGCPGSNTPGGLANLFCMTNRD